MAGKDDRENGPTSAFRRAVAGQSRQPPKPSEPARDQESRLKRLFRRAFSPQPPKSPEPVRTEAQDRDKKRAEPVAKQPPPRPVPDTGTVKRPLEQNRDRSRADFGVASNSGVIKDEQAFVRRFKTIEQQNTARGHLQDMEDDRMEAKDACIEKYEQAHALLKGLDVSKPIPAELSIELNRRLADARREYDKQLAEIDRTQAILLERTEELKLTFPLPLPPERGITYQPAVSENVALFNSLAAKQPPKPFDPPAI